MIDDILRCIDEGLHGIMCGCPAQLECCTQPLKVKKARLVKQQAEDKADDSDDHQSEEAASASNVASSRTTLDSKVAIAIARKWINHYVLFMALRECEICNLTTVGDRENRSSTLCMPSSCYVQEKRD